MPRPLLTLSLGLALVLALPGDVWAGEAAPERCDVTIEGRHGGATGTVTVRLSESEARTPTGWWAAFPGVPDRDLGPGAVLSETVALSGSCSARRRYRIVLVHDGAEHVVEHPSEDGYTQERIVDLGAVSRHFGIAPGPDVEPAPVALEGVDLDGEWVRYESNNDPNDGTRIVVDGAQAVITHVPASANRSLREGDVLWRGLSADGSVRVRGSDGNFYPAQLEAPGPARLSLRVQHGGAGNAQTWVRGGGCWPAEVMADRPRTPGMWVHFSAALPDGFTQALRDARDARAAIQTAAVAPDGAWVVVAAGHPCYSVGFPDDVRRAIDGAIASGRTVDVVAFGTDGRWAVLGEDVFEYGGALSNGTVAAVRRAQARGPLSSFAFGPTSRGFAVSAGGEAEANDAARSPIISGVIEEAEAGLRPVHDIAIAPGGEPWVVVAEDWVTTGGAPPRLREQLERYRTAERRRIDHVVLHRQDGETAWAIVSNGPEPAPAPDDLVNLVEQRLVGDSTLYQRMATHGVVGLSLALVENNRVAWARSYGLRDAADPESYVFPTTLFDAASISKPVSYAAALQLVDGRALDLTRTGVLFDLSGGDMPSRRDLEGVRADEIHLAHLLSHCAGLQNEKGVSGAQEFSHDDRLPTIRQIFRGEGPAASGNAIVRVDGLGVGDMMDYSGANSVLIQALMDQHANGGYDGQVQRLLDALGMTRSSFRRDLLGRIPKGALASGHRVDDDGRVHAMTHRVYPNQAAAALRTTASELAQFVVLINQGGRYGGRQLLDSTTVDRFLGRDGGGTPPGVAEAACDAAGTMQLGVRASDQGSLNEEFWHGGLHNGYRTLMVGLPRRQAGFVMLGTGNQGAVDALGNEIRSAIRAAYGWHP